MEISARYEALEWAAQQFGRAYVDVDNAGRGLADALRLATASTGEGTASAAVTSAANKLSRTLDAVCRQLIDIGGGLHGAVATYREADQRAAGADPPRQGRPS